MAQGGNCLTTSEVIDLLDAQMDAEVNAEEDDYEPMCDGSEDDYGMDFGSDEER